MDRIQFDSVSKRYVLGAPTDARESLAIIGRRLVGLDKTPAAEVWPLRDVSFSVGDGESLGIIGANGAGKSTLLKVLAGITVPTSGSSRTRGRIAALLEVGTGFHWELTGRENVYLSGAVLGMSRRDISQRFDQIVDFAGVERFLGTPVKHYSSGMYLRLAFAVAAHLEPDILVVDEILAVGDAEFQRKCLGRMEEAEAEGRTLVFVSHDLDSLASVCSRSIWLDGGRVEFAGPSRQVIERYLLTGVQEDSQSVDVEAGPIRITGVQVLDRADPSRVLLMRDRGVQITVDFVLANRIPALDATLYITSRRGVRIADEALSDGAPGEIAAGSYRVVLDVPPLLNVGDFLVGVWFGTPYESILDAPALARFTLHGSDRGRPARALVLGSPPQLLRRDGPTSSGSAGAPR